jgi:AcrR family transcriptional regulator
MTQGKRPHHHGNLRAALIAAGLDLVREGGPGALSIRKVAARAGVSHAAPAHHFANLAALRTAVAAAAHREFTATMEAAIAEAPPDDPQAAIVAAGIGYLRFARANPGLFHVMFGSDEIDPENAELRAAGAASYGVLARVCAPVAHGPEGAQGTETLVWSLAHGFAALMVGGKPELQDPAAAERIFRAIFPTLPTAGNSISDKDI